MSGRARRSEPELDRLMTGSSDLDRDEDAGLWPQVNRVGGRLRVLSVSLAFLMALVAGLHGNLDQASIVLVVAVLGWCWTR